MRFHVELNVFMIESERIMFVSNNRWYRWDTTGHKFPFDSRCGRFYCPNTWRISWAAQSLRHPLQFSGILNERSYHLCETNPWLSSACRKENISIQKVLRISEMFCLTFGTSRWLGRNPRWSFGIRNFSCWADTRTKFVSSNLCAFCKSSECFVPI